MIGLLERFERHRGRQQAAEHDCSRHTNAKKAQIQLCKAVLAQGDERNAAKIGQCGVLEHHLSQTLGAIAYDAIEANTAPWAKGSELVKRKKSKSNPKMTKWQKNYKMYAFTQFSYS